MTPSWVFVSLCFHCSAGSAGSNLQYDNRGGLCVLNFVFSQRRKKKKSWNLSNRKVLWSCLNKAFNKHFVLFSVLAGDWFCGWGWMWPARVSGAGQHTKHTTRRLCQVRPLLRRRSEASAAIDHWKDGSYVEAVLVDSADMSSSVEES